MHKKLYILLLFLLAATASFAQKTVRIYGTVSDGEGKPLNLVSVYVEKSALTTLTNEKGYYSVHVPAKDSVTIRFTCFGYRPFSRVITPSGNEMQVSVKLRPIEWMLENEVVVIGTRSPIDGMQQMEPGKAKIMPSTLGGDIGGVVKLFTGVNSNNELSSQYSVRGGNFDENMVYVNGIEIYRPLLVKSGQQEGLSFVNPDLVSELSFSAGGFSAKYGDKMSSVLDITYKKPKQPLEGSVSGGFLGATAYIGQRANNFSQIHGFRYKTASSLLKTLDTKGEYNPNFLDYQLYLTYNFSEKWEVGLLGNFSRNQYNFVPKTRSTCFGTLDIPIIFTVYFDGKERDEFLTSFGALTLTSRAIKNTELFFTASAFFTNETETYDITGEYWLNELMLDPETQKADPGEALAVGSYHEHARNRLNSSVTAMSHSGVTKLFGNEVRWGISFQREIMDDRIREWERRDSAGYNHPHTGQGVNMVYNLFSRNKMNTNRFNAYLQDTYKFGIEEGTFAVTGGLRAGHWDFNDEWIFSPRFSFSFIPKLNPNLKRNFVYRLSTGIYYQTPFYKEVREPVKTAEGNTVVLLNENIKSQRSFQVVAGMDYGFRAINDRRFKFTTEIYYKKLSDLIPYSVDNVSIRYAGRNISSGYATGLDMKIGGEFVPGTDSWLNVSFMKSKETIDGITVPRPTDQLYNISLFFQDYFPKYPKWKMQLIGHLAGGLPIAPSNSGYTTRTFRTTPYRRVDIGMSRELIGEDDRKTSSALRHIRSLWVGIDVFNLLDIKNVNSYYWITDPYNCQWAVPNYLTGRQLNLRLMMDF